jgi:hypothetical protein
MSVGVKLLADIRNIFSSKAIGRIPSAELVKALVEMEGHPWADWKGGKPITQNGLALQLAPFAIVSGNRVGVDRVAKGYQVAHFQDAFERYL